MDKQRVPFTVYPTQDTRIVVEFEGNKYELGLRLIVLDVSHNGLMQTDQPHIPQFELQAQLITNTKVLS